MQRLSHFINNAHLEKPRHTRRLKAEANAIPAQWLEPGAQYRLKLRYNLGNRTVGRIEVVNRGKLIAKQLYFQPSSDVEFFDFKFHMIWMISCLYTYQQLVVPIFNIRISLLRKNDGWWAKSENDNPANVRHLQHSAALVRH